jgi:CheY-like chemotaxis protein
MARNCILVVEENEPFRYYLTHTIQMHGGYVVVEAEDGPAGLARWLSMDPKPGLVLAAINMRRMNGLDLAAKLREHQQDVRILFISADGKPEFDLLRKPFTGDDLMDLIRRRLSARQEIKNGTQAGRPIGCNPA